jgi:hypothetical protein
LFLFGRNNYRQLGNGGNNIYDLNYNILERKKIKISKFKIFRIGAYHQIFLIESNFLKNF